MSNSPKYDLRNAQFAGGLVDAEAVNAEQIGGNINNYTLQQRQNLILQNPQTQNKIGGF